MKRLIFILAVIGALATSCGAGDEKRIYYTTNDALMIPLNLEAFDAKVVSHTFEDGQCTIEFEEPITKIGQDAFKNCLSLRTIVIPDNVTTIGDSAFEGCCKLESMTIGKGVNYIGKRAFVGCTGTLTINCNVPSVIQDICEGAVEVAPEAVAKSPKPQSGRSPSNQKNYKREKVWHNSDEVLSESRILPKVSPGTFYGSKFTAVVIGPEVTSIGKNAFYSCNSLQRVCISDLAAWCRIDFGNTSSNPLYYADELHVDGVGLITDVVALDGVTSIGSFAFCNYDKLTSVIIPDNVHYIGSGAFYGCRNLKSVKISNTITTIGGATFMGCENLASVVIPDSVTEIGESAFENCSSLQSVTIGKGVMKLRKRAFCGCRSLESILIPEGVILIGDEALRDCRSLTSITIPWNVVEFGDRVLYNCRNITSYQGKYASKDSRCLVINGVLSVFVSKGVSTYAIPEGVIRIDNGAFANCNSLTSITIPDSVVTIGEGAFQDCDNLEKVVLGKGLTTIERYAFKSCENLKSITIPSSVKTIDRGAFYDCSGLKSISIPNGVKSIDYETFKYCSNLTSVTIGKSVTSIGNSAFYGCSNLASITIPSGVTSIGDHAFDECSGLKSVTIGKGVTSIGYYAFDDFAGELTIHCEASYGSFSGGDFSKVIIGNGVAKIEERAFANCKNLKSVTIGKGVTSIGEKAFYNCTNLSSVYCKAKNPPKGGDYMFSRESYYSWSSESLDCSIYVPTASVDAYKSASYWSSHSWNIEGYEF